MEHNREPKNKPIHLWSINLKQKASLNKWYWKIGPKTKKTQNDLNVILKTIKSPKKKQVVNSLTSVLSLMFWI